ncbi:hypothetical protein BBI17_008744, partial [Phytophthora kernoviae]
AIRGIVKLQSLARGVIYRMQFGLQQSFPIPSPKSPEEVDAFDLGHRTKTTKLQSADLFVAGYKVDEYTSGPGKDVDDVQRGMVKFTVDKGCDPVSDLAAGHEVDEYTSGPGKDVDDVQRGMVKFTVDKGCDPVSDLAAGHEVDEYTSGPGKDVDDVQRGMVKFTVDKGCDPVSDLAAGHEVDEYTSGPGKDVDDALRVHLPVYSLFSHDSETERIARIMQGSMQYWFNEETFSSGDDDSDEDGYF